MKNTSTKVLPIFACGAILICSLIRFFQYVSIMDFATGFFDRGAEPMGNLIYALTLGFCVIFAVLAFIGHKKGEAAYYVSSDGMGSHATQFLGASMIAGAFLTVWGTFSDSDIPVKIAAFVAAAAFLGMGFLLLKNVVPPAYTGIFMMIGAVYVFLRTCKYFLSDLVILNHSDTLLTMLAYVFFTAFLASSARFYTRFETKRSRLREIITTGAAFIFCSMHVLAKLLALAFGGIAVGGMEGINMDIAAGALISGTFLFVLFFTKKSKDIVVLDDEIIKK